MSAAMWEQAESGRVTHPFEGAVLVATLAMIPILIIQRDATSSGWQNFAEAANWVIWAVFSAELAFVLTVAPRKKAALRASDRSDETSTITATLARIEADLAALKAQLEAL